MPAKKIVIDESIVIPVDGFVKYIYDWGTFRLSVYVNKEWFTLYHSDANTLYFYAGDDQVTFKQPLHVHDVVEAIYRAMKLHYKVMKKKETPINAKWNRWKEPEKEKK